MTPALREGAAAAGAIVRRQQNGNERTETSLAYRLHGREVTLLGPSTERFVDGESVGVNALGCGETVHVFEDRSTHADVGGQRWYFTERACRAAPDDEGGGPGGC